MSLSQKAAVVQAVKEALGDSFDTAQPVSKQLTADQLADIKNTIVSQIQSGDVAYNKEVDEATLKKYVSGMVSNHFRKAKELNGGQIYTPSSTGGSKSKDSQLVALNSLKLRFTEGTDEYTKVQNAIQERQTTLSSLKAEEVKKKKEAALPEIDMEALPSEFHDLLGM